MRAAAYVIGAVALLALVSFAAFTVGTKRAVQSYVQPAAEKKIEERTAKKLEQSAAEAERDEKEIRDADGDAFIDLARRLLWPE